MNSEARQVTVHGVAKSRTRLSDQTITAIRSVQGFPRQEYWSGLHSLLQGIFPTQGSNVHLLHWQVGSLLLSHQGSLFYYKY